MTISVSQYLIAAAITLQSLLWCCPCSGQTPEESGWQASVKKGKLAGTLLKSSENKALTFQQDYTIIRDNLTLQTNAVIHEEDFLAPDDGSQQVMTTKPDERVLWHLFNAKKDKQVKKIIGQWQKDFPGWSPPLELLEYLDDRQKIKRQRKIAAQHLARQQERQRLQAEQLKILEQKKNNLADAFITQSPDKLILASNKGKELFNCRNIANVVGLLPIFSFSHDQQELLTLFQDTMMAPDCQNESSRLAILENSQNYLDVSSFDNLLTWALPLLKETKNQASLQEINYRHQTMHLANAIKDEREHLYLKSLIDSLDGKISAHRDTPVAISIAWSLLPDYPELSLNWFENAANWSAPNSDQYREAIYGMALAMQKEGKDDELIDLLGSHIAEIPKLQKLRDEVVLRRATLLFKEGNYQQALQLTEQYQETIPELSSLSGKNWLVQAWQSHREKDFQKSRSLANKALSNPSTSDEASTLLAWLDYGEGHYQEALGKLVPLHQKEPGEDLAAAIVNCYRNLDADRASFTQLAASDPIYLGPLVEEVFSEDLFWRKEFLAAKASNQPTEYFQNTTYAKTPRSAIMSQANSPGRDEQKLLLAGIDSSWVAGNLIYRNKGGESGTSKLSLLYFPTVKANYIHDNINEFSLSGQKISLTSGQLDPWNTPVGSAGVLQNGNRSLTKRPDIKLTDAYTFGLQYQQSGWWHPFFKIGLTPTQAEVDPALTFGAGVKKQTTRGNWELELFSKPVRESILSFSGMKDPYSNLSWGRVLQAGIGGNFTYSLTPKWGLYGEGQVARLTGERVDSNKMFQFSSSLGYKLSLKRFNYFSIGPYADYSHYDKNRSHFTLGHGGYFSPERFQSFGLAVDFLTNEGEKYIIKGRAGGGYQNIDNDEAELFPGQPGLKGKTILSSDASIINKYAADHSAGTTFFMEFIGSWLVTSHWQINSGISYQETRGYQDYCIGIGLRYFFRPRRASWSTDIPPPMFEAIR